jgi:hypothetical protein
MLKVRILWLVAGLLLVSCAIPEAPPGGPEDKTPPEVTATRPLAGASGVPTDTKIEIEFSEKMRTVRFERSVELFPAAKVSKARWKKNLVSIEFEEPLHPDTTYIVSVKAGFADAHNVRSDRPFDFAFATSAQIDTGSIAGTVYFRRKPSNKAVVKLFVLPKDSSFTPASTRPDREVLAKEDGTYEFGYLPAREVPFVLFAFHDANGNTVFDRDNEVGETLPDTLVLAGARPRLVLQDIYIVDPKEPASITGFVVNATKYDSVPVTITLHEAADTVPPTYITRADDKGDYTFRSVLKGVYALYAFLDLKRDSVCGSYPCPEDSTTECREFCVSYPESVRVSPGDEIRLMNLRLEAPTGAKE